MKNLPEELLIEEGIFANKNILRSTYVPDKLPHRNEQIATLTDILSVVLKGETPSNILIYGKAGTGKTVTVKYVSKELEAKARKKGCNCSIIYINCELFDTLYRVIVYLARVFNIRVPMNGWPADVVYSELKKGIDTENRSVIVVLDEMDKLPSNGDEALYNLLRINSELNKARVSVIGITNDLTLAELLDQRVKSSLSEEEIIFPPYNIEQLKDILLERAVKAFNDSVLDDAVVPLCIAFAAQAHEDAARALELLRESGEIAEQSKSKRVCEEHVRLANKKIEADSMVEVVKTLPLQSKILLNSVLTLTREKNERFFISGEVYNVYGKLCDHFGMKTLTPRRLTVLLTELDILGLINAKDVYRGRHGNTREVSLIMQEELVETVLLEDHKLKALSDIRLKT